ncbi:PQQ-binding-like beta-propeller repeat protein [Spiroplasma poulsonii]|nr:PQQ-binding-like beta-propeller repeat protein [Spiroplasma poulsonii]
MENIVISSRYNEYGFSDGVSYHDTLYFVNYNRVFSYNQKLGNVELAMQIKNKIVTNGVVYNNKLYFAADDYYVYGYNPRNNQVNKILKASNLIKSNGIVVENKLYFGSDDYCLYEYDAETNVVKVVLTADAEIRHSGTVYNNKLYFGTENGDFYVYDLKTNSFKVWKANDEVTVSDSGVIVNDYIYFTGIMKDKSSIYKLDLKTNLIWTWTFILPGKYISSIMFLNNKIYFFMTSIGNQAPIGWVKINWTTIMWSKDYN